MLHTYYVTKGVTFNISKQFSIAWFDFRKQYWVFYIILENWLDGIEYFTTLWNVYNKL